MSMSPVSRMTSALPLKALSRAFSLITGTYTQPIRVMFSVTAVLKSHFVPSSLSQPRNSAPALLMGSTGLMAVLPLGTICVA